MACCICKCILHLVSFCVSLTTLSLAVCLAITPCPLNVCLSSSRPIVRQSPVICRPLLSCYWWTPIWPPPLWMPNGRQQRASRHRAVEVVNIGKWPMHHERRWAKLSFVSHRLYGLVHRQVFNSEDGNISHIIIILKWNYFLNLIFNYQMSFYDHSWLRQWMAVNTRAYS